MTDGDDVLAAEFALGLLDAAEAEAVQARARADAALSLRIAWWRDQFAPLAREAEAEPPPELWARIDAKLPANDDRSDRLMKRWRAAAVAAMTVAAALLVFIGMRPVVPPQPLPAPNVQADPLIATLADPKTRAVVNVSYDRTSERITVAPAALETGRGDAELWIIPADGVPRSLGVIDAHKPARHRVARAHGDLIGEGGTFAITLEPKGGSPKPGPTGPVIVAGKIVRT